MVDSEREFEEEAVGYEPPYQGSAPPRSIVMACCAVLGICLLFGSARALQLQLSTPDSTTHIEDFGRSITEMSAMASGLIDDRHASAESMRLLADQAEILALGDSSGEALCAAWRLRVEALRRDPNESPLLLELAARARSSKFRHCDAGGVTPASISASLHSVAHYALHNAPYDMATLRTAGLMLLQQEERDDGLKALNTYLTFATNVPASFETSLFITLRDGQELLTLVPPRFPQVLRWSDRVLNGANEPYLAALAELQKQAIDESARSVLREEAPLHVHGQRLFNLLPRAANDDVRRIIDRELMAYFAISGNSTGKDLFAERAPLRQIPVMIAFQPGDTRVTKTALAHWVGNSSPITIDSYFNSVGFFVPEGGRPKVVMLQSQERSRIDSQSLQLLRSADNQSWEEVSIVSRKQFDVERRTFIMLTPQTWGYPYWKLHYKSPQRNDTFRNQAGIVLQVYGG